MGTPKNRVKAVVALAVLYWTGFGSDALANESAPATQFRFRIPAATGESSSSGRLLLFISTSKKAEPRFQIDDSDATQQVFGMDVQGVADGDSIAFAPDAIGYPLPRLGALPAGNYTVQALLNRYQRVQRSSGPAVYLPMDRGEGQHYARKPGNVYSAVRGVHIDPAQAKQIVLDLNQRIPALPKPVQTDYVKHVRMLSPRLSKFWQRPTYLGAFVRLPEGYATHPKSHYPLVINHGHFPLKPFAFRETPPDKDLAPEYSERFRWPGYNRTVQEESFKLYKTWTGANFPRMIVVEIQHANAFYDDSYAVNSANIGPYGDAITYELIPYLEKRFRAIGKPWARFLYGGSTGGWEALAAQVFYPDEYNGAYAACPDPIDFRAYTIVNLYQDKNAYYSEGPFKQTPRPGKRDYLGRIESTIRQMNLRERALGSHGRSGDQWDAWQAVFSPMGADGYPMPIWDKRSGRIDATVARYWRDHYDLRFILQRDWARLGPKLQGKINLYVGDMDSYYLNDAVYLMEDFLKSTRNPPFGGEIDYGDRAEHCWNGDHSRPNAISRLRYPQTFFPKIVQRITATAPKGADLSSWQY